MQNAAENIFKFNLASLSFGDPVGEDNGKILRQQLQLESLEKVSGSKFEIELPAHTVSSSFIRGLVDKNAKKYKIKLKYNQEFDSAPILRRLFM